MEDAINKRRKAFATANRSNEERQTYISVSRRASSVIAKAKAGVLQAICASLLSKSNPKSVCSGSFSSSSNFPNCSSPMRSASVFADYRRSHFLSPSQRRCVAEPEATFPSSAKPRALRSLTHPFALLSPPLNFLRLPQTSPRPLLLAQTKLPIP